MNPTRRLGIFARYAREWVLPILCVAFFSHVANAADLSVLNPKIYTSPSGHFALEIKPTTLFGAGEGGYSLTRDGKQIWASQHLFTLWDAAVTDDGIVAGYAYQQGRERVGKFHTVILAPDGTIRLDAATDRQESRFEHAPANPLANGLFIDPVLRHLIVRIRNPDVNAGGEFWQIYDLATGKELANVPPTPPDKTLRDVIRAQPVAGTPLVLLNWWQYDETSKTNPGCVFQLVDLTDAAHPQTVWSKILPGDYSASDTPEDPYASNRLQDQIERDSTILRCDDPGTFELRFVAAKQRVTFQVAKANSPAPPTPAAPPGIWQVRETARAPYTPPPAPTEPKLPVQLLRPLGTLQLGAAPPPRAVIRDIRGFDMDDRGRIGFIRGRAGDQEALANFVLVDAEGKTIVQGVHPPNWLEERESSSTRLAWLHGDRWLVTDCEYGLDKTARAWFVDLVPGQEGQSGARITPVEKFDCPSIETVRASGDGGFVVLARHDYKYTITYELSAFDDRGARKWLISSDYGNAELSSPQDIAVDSARGTIFVLEYIRNRVQVFNLAGKLTRSIDLEKAFGQKSTYPSEIAVAHDGGLLIRDFNAVPPSVPLLWRLNPDDTLHGKLDPRAPDGQSIALRELHISPDDHIWTTDGIMLQRLSPAGQVDRALGQPPDAATEEFTALAVAPSGHIVTAGSRTGTLRVFDSAGKLLHSIKPESGDPSGHSGPDLEFAADGTFYLGTGPTLHFNSDGTRIGWEKTDLDAVSRSWHFLPSTSQRWVVGDESIWLTAADAKAPREIRQQPDGNWLVHPQALAVAPDGSAAVVAFNIFASRSDGGTRPRLNLYSPTGTPIRTISLPDLGVSWSIAYNGKQVILANGGQLFLVNIPNASLSTLQISPTPFYNPYWQLLLAPDGKELWLQDLNHERDRIARYQLPPAE